VNLTPIIQEAQKAERRLRINQGLRSLSLGLLFGLGSALTVIVLRKVGVCSERNSRIALGVCALLPVAAFVWGYSRRLVDRAGAIALDRAHGLADRLSSALFFAEQKDEARSAFMDAAIADALAKVKGVDPVRAVPFAQLRYARPIALLCAGIVVAMLFEVRKHETIIEAERIEPLEVTPDDLDAMRDFLKDFDQKDQSDEVKAATREFNQLIQDLADKRLDRNEAFKRMQQLEEKLLKGRQADQKSFEEALKRLGQELKKSDLTKAAGESLESKNLAQAEKDMKELAKKLRENKPDQAQLDKMREALKKAAESQKEREESIQKRRDELEKQAF
jgi:hypothetical protein